MSDAIISFPIFGENFSFSPSRSISFLGLTLNWYGIIIAIGFSLAVLYTCRRLHSFGLTQDNFLDMLLCAVPSSIVGARLYFVIFNPDLYFGPGKYLGIFKIWEGGLAIYGAVIGALTAALIFCRVKKLKPGPFLDVGGLGLLIGQSVGRWGNFMNREAHGGVTDVPWKMGLTAASGTIYVHPTFLYESLWNIAGFVILHFVSKKRKFDGQVFLLYVAWYGLGRFFIEGLRTDSLYFYNTNIRVSQILAILSMAVALSIMACILILKKPTPAGLYVNAIKLVQPADVDIEETLTEVEATFEETEEPNIDAEAVIEEYINDDEPDQT